MIDMTPFSILSTKILDPSLQQEVQEKGMVLTEVAFITTQLIQIAETKQTVLHWIRQAAETGAIFTSKHAVEYIGVLLKHDGIAAPPHWKIYCLSGATLKYVQQYFSEQQIVHTAATAGELANAILQGASKIPLVFFCGDQRRDELPSLLQGKNISLTEVVVYETIATPQVINAAMDAILFFSPSAVKSFFSVNRLSKNTICFAIGPTTANAISGFTNNTIITSKTPGQQALLQEVYQYIELNTYRK